MPRMKGSVKRVPGDVPTCWYCGDDFRVEVWTVNDKPSPLCALHSATTRASLLLRDCGKHVEADAFDNVIGIDTRPRMARFEYPEKGKFS